MTHRSDVTHQEADSAAIWLPEGGWVGWGVSEVLAAFVTTLATGVAEQQTKRR
jgi:hypothetical protein